MAAQPFAGGQEDGGGYMRRLVRARWAQVRMLADFHKTYRRTLLRRWWDAADQVYRQGKIQARVLQVRLAGGVGCGWADGRAGVLGRGLYMRVLWVGGWAGGCCWGGGCTRPAPAPHRSRPSHMARCRRPAGLPHGPRCFHIHGMISCSCPAQLASLSCRTASSLSRAALSKSPRPSRFATRPAAAQASWARTCSPLLAACGRRRHRGRVAGWRCHKALGLQLLGTRVGRMC